MKPMKHKNLKFCHLFNLITFKLFLIGFTINFVAFMNSNWIKNDNYVYGIFQYCTNNINIEYDDSVNIFEFIEMNSQKLTNSGVRCFNWSKSNRPKFIFRFLILQGGCLACHLALLISIIVLKLLASKWWLKRIKKTETKMFDKPSCLNSAKFSLYLNFCFCGAGFLLTSFYCTNLILFHLDQSLTNPAISNEQLSWCFWLSVVGSAITFISICALLSYTIYFKKIKNNSELTSKHETNSKYSLRDFIDAYKKSNSPFYSTNLNCSLPPVPPNSSFASLGIDSYNPNGEMKSTSEDKTESDPPTKDNSNSNTDGNVFFKENSSSLSDSNISKKESIISGEQDEILKSKQNIDNKKVKPQIAIKTTAVPMPSSFIYSQVYPCGKKEKLIQNNKDPMLKMVVLPFGSLSGNIPSNSCNTENQRDDQKQ